MPAMIDHLTTLTPAEAHSQLEDLTGLKLPTDLGSVEFWAAVATAAMERTNLYVRIDRSNHGFCLSLGTETEQCHARLVAQDVNTYSALEIAMDFKADGSKKFYLVREHFN